MLKLKLQYWPPDVKSWLIWKDPDSGKDWGQEEKGTTEDEMFDMGLGVLQELVMGREAWHAAVMGSQSWTRLSDWTELNYIIIFERLYIFFLFIYIWVQ